MSIKREDLDAGRIDFADVTTGKRLPLIHPGEILREDFLRPMKISVYALALAIKAPRSRVNDIVLGRRGITADTAFRLARYFGTSPDFWINLQARYDLEAADRTLRRRIERESHAARRLMANICGPAPAPAWQTPSRAACACSNAGPRTAARRPAKRSDQGTKPSRPALTRAVS
jgi:antitoxin HigA-1